LFRLFAPNPPQSHPHNGLSGFSASIRQPLGSITSGQLFSPWLLKNIINKKTVTAINF
jgi:hypothetical protein